MKIVHCLPSLQLGGIETMLVNIANQQVKANDVFIIVFMNQVESTLLNRLNRNVHFLCARRKRGSLSILPIIKLNYWLWKINPEVIHVHVASLVRLIFYRYLKKTVITLHTTFCKEIVNKPSYYKVKKIFAISYAVQKNLFDRLGLESTVVYNGIDIGPIKSLISHDINHSTFSITQVSRLDHNHKGQHILVQAVAIIKKMGIDRIALDLIGSGPSETYLKNLAKELKVNDIVNFLGDRPQAYIFEHLCEYDLFVQPSIFEGFGITVAEAMAAKIPVLVSENQGPLEIIENGRCGYTFKNGDPEDLANVIIRIIKNGYPREMIEKAYERVCTLYDVRNTSRIYLEQYIDIGLCT